MSVHCLSLSDTLRELPEESLVLLEVFDPVFIVQVYRLSVSLVFSVLIVHPVLFYPLVGFCFLFLCINKP